MTLSVTESHTDGGNQPLAKFVRKLPTWSHLLLLSPLDFEASHTPAPPTPRSLRSMNSLFSYDPPVPSASLPDVNVPGSCPMHTRTNGYQNKVESTKIRSDRKLTEFNRLFCFLYFSFQSFLSPSLWTFSSNYYLQQYCLRGLTLFPKILCITVISKWALK